MRQLTLPRGPLAGSLVAFFGVLLAAGCARAPDARSDDDPAPAHTSRLPCPEGPASDTTYAVQAGDTIALRPGQALRFPDGVTVRLVELIHSPCPEGAACVWSGLGVRLRYEKNGSMVEGVNRHSALGYSTAVVETDYRTCALLSVRPTGG